MSTLLSSTTPSAPNPEGIPTAGTTTRGHGEFIMAGSLTPAGEPETETSATAAMPNFAHRKEVQIMLKKLRDSVSLWKRIPDPPARAARETAERFVLPQHTMYIK